MAIINISLDKGNTALFFNSTQSNIKFAVAKSLTNTAQAIQKDVQEHIHNTFVIRKKAGGFERSIRIKPATKQALQAEVYTMAGFASLQQTGGISKPKSGRLAIPLYNNLNEVKTKAKANKDIKNSFLVKFKSGGYGLATRKGKEMKILFALRSQAYVPKRLNMLEIGEQTAHRVFEQIFNKNIAEII
ncbi:MAG: hypothetical protein R3Y43_01400 [Alphaproteobacteria bacterium]